MVATQAGFVDGALVTSGIGSFFFVPTPQSTPENPLYESFLWRAQFPDHIRNDLVTWTNPLGSISNSDLELAATLAQHDVIAHTTDVVEATIGNLHDNTPVVFWNRKGSSSTGGPAAYFLRL